MRYFFLIVTVVLIVMMLIVYFQNYSIGVHQQLFFLTNSRSVNAANGMLYAYIFGTASMLSVILFLTGGKIDFNLPKPGESKGNDEEWS